MDWVDLLVVQGSLNSLIQHRSSKASILLCSAFFIVQLSHPYMTTGKAIALTRWTFFGKEMSLLFNMLSRFLTAFLLRKPSFTLTAVVKSAAVLEPNKIKSVLIFIFPHLLAMKWWDWMPWSLVFWMFNFNSAFSLSSFTFIKRLFRSSSFSAIREVSSAWLRLLILLP